MKQETAHYRLAPVSPLPSADAGSPQLNREERARELDKFFKALSDTTRRRILEILEAQERSVGEIVAEFELSQPTISRHLSVLKEARLVVDRRRGQQVLYRLAPQILARSAGKFFTHFASWRDLVGH